MRQAMATVLARLLDINGARDTGALPAAVGGTVPLRCACIAVVLTFAWLLPAPAAADAPRVLISWTSDGPPDRPWQGTARLTHGELADPYPLGQGADCCAAGWIEAGQLFFAERVPRQQSGFAVELVGASDDSALVITLARGGDVLRNEIFEIRCADIQILPSSYPFADGGGTLIVRRDPADVLSIELDPASCVLRPGQPLGLSIQAALDPGILPAKDRETMRVLVEVTASDDAQRSAFSRHWPLAEITGQPLELDVVLPEQERAWCIEASLLEPVPGQSDGETERGWGFQATREALSRLPAFWGRNRDESNDPGQWETRYTPLVWRGRDVMVLDPQRELPVPESEASWDRVDAIDLEGTPWWQRMPTLRLIRWPQESRLGKSRERSFGGGARRVEEHPQGRIRVLEPAQGNEEAGWEAHFLRVRHVGQPHVIEIEYPEDAPQTLGVAVVERPDRPESGTIRVGGYDLSGRQVAFTRPESKGRYRMVFWPRTETPMVLLTNQRRNEPAFYRSVSLYHVGTHLDRTELGMPASDGRRAYVQFDDPRWVDHFAARRKTRDGQSDPQTRQPSWTTYRDATDRLAECLHHGGYSGAVVPVNRAGELLYPSGVLPACAERSGELIRTDDEDTSVPDVLEMMATCFDREQLELIPVLDFDMPIPSLEARLRSGGPDGIGLRWVNGQGRTWLQVHSPDPQGRAPYYNILHPAVQQSVLEAVREVVSRYGEHASFGGLGLRASSHGYAALRDPRWGFDDATLSAFLRDTTVVPHIRSGPQGENLPEVILRDHRDAWVAWRADRLREFYRRVLGEIRRVRPEAVLVVSLEEMFEDPAVQEHIGPSLPERGSLRRALVTAGIDPSSYQSDLGIVLLEPSPVLTYASPRDSAEEIALAHVPDRQATFDRAGSPRGVSLFPSRHAMRLRLPGETGDEIATCRTVSTALCPGGAAARRRYVHALALSDAGMIVDSGLLQPWGQRDELKAMLDTFRQLPRLHFESFDAPPSEESLQPVTIRYATTSTGLYVYLVNDSPFDVDVRLRLRGLVGAPINELTGRRAIRIELLDDGQQRVHASLRPYDLVALQMGDRRGRIVTASVDYDDRVRGVLARELDEVSQRFAACRKGIPAVQPPNAGFEMSGETPGEPIRHWHIDRAPDGDHPVRGSVRIDRTWAIQGEASAHLIGEGPRLALVSQPFEHPGNVGLVTVSLWLGVPHGTSMLPLEFTFEGRAGQGRFHRVAQIGKIVGTDLARSLRSESGLDWYPVEIPVRELPAGPLRDIRLRFDLADAGEVWIDDVHIQVATEYIELMKLLPPARVGLGDGRVSDCMAFLDSYWPRYLSAYVELSDRGRLSRTEGGLPPADGGSADGEDAVSTSEGDDPERPTGVLGRLRSYLTPKLW